MELRGKVVVITGASRGLGAGLAAEMTRHGIHLGLCARTAPALANSETVLAAQCDVTDGKAMDAFANVVIERFGGIDLWINNAGVLDPIAPLRDLETEAFRRHIDINLTGVFHGTRAFVRHLHEAGTRGVLINISSGAGRKGYAGWSAYCAGKGAVDRLTEAVQVEEAEYGLRAHAVAPGIIDTDMQTLIRACEPERFPMVERFKELKRADAFNSTAFVARELLKIAFQPKARPEGVLVRLADEK